ncbi:MAG: M20 family metallopeptidase, partial [Abditibacteriales bacterium]|nr:M20 family metallopeptidase [Abditibacteriales bacterium]
MSLHIDQTELIALLQSLLRLDTTNPPGNEAAAAQLIADWARRWGMEAEVMPVADDRANVLVTVRGSGHRPALLFNGHTDVVPPGDGWTCDPFGGEVRDSKVFGRGAADMKGGVAAMLVAMRAVAQMVRRAPHAPPLQGDLMLLGTAGEEVDHIGAYRFLQHETAARVGAVVISEPTSLDLVVAHRGAMWVKLTTHGKSAHGSTPHLGVNAILHMMHALQRLDRHRFTCTPHPLLAPPTLNVGVIRGGTKENVVADRCEVELDIRIVPSQTPQDVLDELHKLLSELQKETPDFRYDLQLLQAQPAVETSPEHPLIQTAQRIARAMGKEDVTPRSAPYYTDGSVLQPHLKVP